ncbi:MAG TPA: hypothetical protein ENH29_06180, partial [Bacteroidetes bacterium]|nr:hypothetical protein [Bacteroidota bacterium]
MKSPKVKFFTVLFSTIIFAGTVLGDVPRTLYVLNGTARTLSKMNLETGEILNDFVQVGQWPNQIITFNDKLYILNSGTNDIMVIDPQNDGSAAKTIALAQGSNPYKMVFVGLNKVYITNLVAGTVSVVNVSTGAVLKEIPVGVGPEGILVVEGQAFVCNTGGYPAYDPSTVSIIDIGADSVVQTLNVPANPQDLALSPDGKIHVICTGNYATIKGQVAVIDRYAGPGWKPAVVDTIEIGGAPGDILITPDGKAYLPDFGVDPDGYLYSYNAFSGSILHGAGNPIKVGFGAMNLFFDGKENVLWIANFGDDTAQKFDISADTVLATYGFGLGAQDMVIVEPIQSSDPWADAVAGFTPGQNWSHLGEAFFPINVLGPPDQDPALTPYNPSSKPEEILSLGDGGEIILQFTDNKIVNGPGADFTVFENPFISLFDGSVFVEAAIVSVSQDGQNWVTFPYDTTDMSGLAGVTPTKNNLQPLDPSVSGGDQFDLEDVGLAWATYVKLTDLGDIYKEGLYNGDFDLDAVAAINSEPLTRVVENGVEVQPVRFHLGQNYPNPFNPETMISYSLPKSSNVELKIFNSLGREVFTLVAGTKNAGTYRVMWRGQNQKGDLVNSGV